MKNLLPVACILFALLFTNCKKNSETPEPNPEPVFQINNLTQITQDGYHPKWSPDGNMIVYTIWNDGDSELWIYDLQTQNSYVAVQGTPGDLCPTWSPDSRSIAFDAYRSESDHRLQVWIKNLDTGEFSMFTDYQYSCITPDWSSDGTEIAFLGNGQIKAKNVNTGTLRTICDITSSYTVNWNYNDTQIAFPMGDDQESFDIYTVDSNGNNLARITTDSGRENRPVWSPDGEIIAYEEFTGNTADVYLYFVESGRSYPLSDNFRSGFPDWSPNGDRLVFANRSGLWLVDIEFEN